MSKNINLFVSLIWSNLKTIYQPLYDDLIGRLIEARKNANLTQTQLAKKLGKPQSYIAKIENKDRKLDVIEFVYLSQALDSKASEILALVECYDTLLNPQPNLKDDENDSL